MSPNTYTFYGSRILKMARVGLSVISIFNCKHLFRSRVYPGITEKMMVSELQQIITPSRWVWCLLYFIFISYAVSLQIVSLAWSPLGAMAAGDASQTTPVKIMQVFMCCIALFYTNYAYVCNFNSCKNFTCYMVCIN